MGNGILVSALVLSLGGIARADPATPVSDLCPGTACASCGEPALCYLDAPYCPSCQPTPRCSLTPYVRGEYLLWWATPDEVPPLATTSPPASMGFLGQPGTQILFGGGELDDNPQSGARFALGLWLDDKQTWGIEGGMFFLGPEESQTILDSTQFPVLARPVFALNFNQEFSELVAFPGLATGRFGVQRQTFLWGNEINFMRTQSNTCTFRNEWFLGFRHVDLDEDLLMRENIIAGPTAPLPVGTLITVEDRFDTDNTFYGGQLGGRAQFQRGGVFVDVRGSVALGVTQQFIQISGSQVVARANGGADIFTGGLLTAPSNIGRFTRDEFGVVPEVRANLGYEFGPHLRVFVGYTFLYWSNVIRPGSEIDRNIDVTLIPNFAPPGTVPTGQRRPGVQFNDQGFWAQGVSFGAQITW